MTDTTGFTVIAHRGASSYAPENTFAAFDLALEMGASHLELDVHLTADDEIVVIHDDTVDRTTDGTGTVSSHTIAALRALDAGSWFGDRFKGTRVPSFGEVLERYAGRAYLHVELKGRSAGLSRRTIDAIRTAGMTRDVTMTSFQKIRLEEVRSDAPELPAGWLVGDASDAIARDARAIGVTQLCPRAKTLTPDLVRRLHADGFVVRAWGVGTEELMRQVVESGADGMTVNFPDVAIEYLRTRASSR